MVDMQKLTHGVLHTKFWVVDQTHFYLGSANMDWRSLTQVCVYPAHLHCLLLNFPIHSVVQLSEPYSYSSLGLPLSPTGNCQDTALEVLSTYLAFIVHSLCVFEAHL